jgi:LSD1 subclass zinc finger protein
VAFLLLTCEPVQAALQGERAEPPSSAYNAGMIPQDLLDILVCPVCKKPLQLKATGESLKCAECRRVYPVRDNIPILLVDEAKIDAA